MPTQLNIKTNMKQAVEFYANDDLINYKAEIILALKNFNSMNEMLKHILVSAAENKITLHPRFLITLSTLLTNLDHEFFCVMGVFCEIVPEIQWDRTQLSYNFKPTNQYFRYAIPDNILDYFQLEYTDINFLIEKNDADRWSFNQCAKWIKENM